MLKDVRETDLYREAEAFYKTVRQPGTGQISDAAEVHVATDGQQAVFSGTLIEELEGVPSTRICWVDLRSGHTKVLTSGPNTDRLPKYSPDGRHIAFLSDRHRIGDFQLYLLDVVSGSISPTPSLEGWVEYLHWSPDGTRILLGVAGHGADIAGVQGAVTSASVLTNLPSWMPTVETGNEGYRWRRAWVYECASNRLWLVSPLEINCWETVWCGNDTIVALISYGAGEGRWYGAELSTLQVKTGDRRVVYKPQDQLGWLAGSPSGKSIAVVEAICSDRCFVAGNLRLIDRTSGRVQSVDTLDVDIAYTEWRSDAQLLLAGHRGFETVVGVCDTAYGTFTEIWNSRDIATGGVYITVSGLNEIGDCALVGESFLRAPEIAVIRGGEYRAVKSFDLGYADQATTAIERIDHIGWQASDGLEIQGLLLRPRCKGPRPLIMYIHGGPVWHWRPFWLGRRGAAILMLLKRGFAIFFPNPRGSSGRGQDFARRVVGDMGGADTFDYLSGLDHLVEHGIADPRRVGLTGLSYGGFMTSWLITQNSRFVAAVPMASITNWVSEHLISNIPHWTALFLADTYTNPDGKYFNRSPIMHAHKAKTPTLNICGALDRCTPPEEAVQFHNALLENGVHSVLVTYPEEGHGIRRFPAVIDCAARVVNWFQQHMSVEVTTGEAEIDYPNN